MIPWDRRSTLNLEDFCFGRIFLDFLTSSIHLPANVVSPRAIIASVQGCKPSAFPVSCHTTSHPVRIGPQHLTIVANGSAETEGFNTVPAEESHLVVPVLYCPLPVMRGRTKALFENVEVLTDTKPTYSSAVRTIVAEPALVCMTLSNLGELWIPIHLFHVTSSRLRTRPAPPL